MAQTPFEIPQQLRELAEKNVEQARYLASLVESHPELELLAPVSLNVVCYAYKAPELPLAGQNELNREILMQLQENGIAVPSSTMIRGRFAIRVAITNHRSQHEDFDLLVAKSVEYGQKQVFTTEKQR